MHTGQVILALAILLPLAGLLVRAGRKAQRARSGQARPKAGGGIVSGWFQHRRDKAMENARHYNGMLREAARHRHRLTEQEHAAKVRASARGGGPASDSGDFSGPDGGARPPRQTVIGRVIRLGKPPAGPGAPAEARPPSEPYRRRTNAEAEAERAAAAGDGTADRPASPAGGDTPPAAPPRPPEPPARGGQGPAARPSAPAPGSPAVPSPGASRPQSQTLEGVVVTIQPDSPGTLAVPGVEMIIEGANALRRYMLSGDARAKLRGVLGIEAAGDCLAGTVRALSTAMAEPGQHYGPEVTEPLAMSAVHYSAASLGLSEVEGRIAAIVRAAEDLRDRGVQAPHHSQMAEGGGALGHNGGYARTAPPNTYVDPVRR